MQPNVSSVMTAKPITVSPQTPVKEIAGLLARHRISSVAVVDEHERPLGVVSELDLLGKHVYHFGDTYPGLFTTMANRRLWRKAQGTRAETVMTAPAHTIERTATVRQAASALANAGLRRLLVVADGVLVGVVSRRDLMRVFARSDEAIRTDVEVLVNERVIGAEQAEPHVHVIDGVVTLTGELERRSQTMRAGELAGDVPGVLGVENRLSYDVDDVSAARV